MLSLVSIWMEECSSVLRVLLLTLSRLDLIRCPIHWLLALCWYNWAVNAGCFMVPVVWTPLAPPAEDVIAGLEFLADLPMWFLLGQQDETTPSLDTHSSTGPLRDGIWRQEGPTRTKKSTATSILMGPRLMRWTRCIYLEVGPAAEAYWWSSELARPSANSSRSAAS